MRAEVLVIGAGTAGLRTAMTASSNGLKTVLVGDGQIAGTCLNTGCIPTKTMLYAAEQMASAKKPRVGVSLSAKPNFAAIMRRVRAISKEGRDHATKAVKANKNLTYLEGRATFAAKNVVEVGQYRIVAERIIVATGTKAFIPPIPGLNDVPFMTNEEVVELTKKPRHVMLLGGGYISCEYATFFARLGIKVTIIERGDGVLSVLDEDIRKPIRQSLESMGVRILTNAVASKVTHKKGIYTVTLTAKSARRVTGDCLVVCCGRVPNTQGLGLENAHIKINKRGFIETDLTCRTSNKSVYAIGDVNGVSLFAHTAKREGWIALEHILFEKHSRMDYDKIPWAVFTAPVAAGVGMSEFQLQANNESYEVLEAEFSHCGKAKIIQEDEGKVKVLHQKGKIVGAFIVGPQADNLIHEFVALMHMGKMGVATLQRMVHAHPTLAEVCESLRARK